MAGVKQSDFNTVQSIGSGSFLPFFQSNTNLTIGWDSFITSLGVTGILTPIGDPLAPPVIAKNGKNYNYRTIEAGAGIKTGLSPQDGVLIQHNFKQSPTGTSLTSGMTLPHPVIASVSAGEGITITKVGDVITISLT